MKKLSRHTPQVDSQSKYESNGWTHAEKSPFVGVHLYDGTTNSPKLCERKKAEYFLRESQQKPSQLKNDHQGRNKSKLKDHLLELWKLLNLEFISIQMPGDIRKSDPKKGHENRDQKRMFLRCHLFHMIALISLFAQGCASLSGTKRLVVSAGIGAGAGVIGGATLSPNEESRALNALVFGLSGALISGGIAMITDAKPEPSSRITDLRTRDQGTGPSLDQTIQEFQVLPNQSLPDFLRDRIQPVVIEEYVETDSLSEDGTLHEPHRAYRIKRPGELFARPVTAPKSPEKGGSK